MMTLNQKYETDVKFKVVVKEVPQDVSFSSNGEELVVHISDRGTTLMNYKLNSFLPISVDYSELAKKKGRLYLSSSLAQKRIKKQLQSSTEIVSVTPDTLTYYTQESAVRCPVKVDADIFPARQYALGDVAVVPDSVWVFAPSRIADTLTVVLTEQFTKKDVRDTIRVNLQLNASNELNCNPSEVTVTIPVYPYSQKSFELPVLGIDFPDTYRLRTFPSRVQLKLDVDLNRYDLVKAEDFEIGISYLDIYGSNDNRTELKLLRAPSWVKDVKIVPSTVEYMIEQL